MEFSRVLACLVALLFPIRLATAQTSRGTVTGLILDAREAVVPSAKVDLVNAEKNTIRSTLTNEAGLYRFDAVDPGRYFIRFSKPHFAIHQTEPFELAAAQVTAIDARLEVGPHIDQVNVVPDGAELQTEAPLRLGTIGSRQGADLPVASRNPVSLALTLPGVSTNRGGYGLNTFSLNGGRSRSNNFMLDGTENNDMSSTGQAFEITNVDAIQEVAVQLSNYDAEFGRAGGGVINVITRSGTNQFHGTASYLVETTRLNALTNTEALNADVQSRGRPLPGTDQWFSATLGGPVIRNRTFFFGAFQERRQAAAGSRSGLLASAAGKATLRSLFPSGSNRNVELYLAANEGAAANTQLGSVSIGPGRPLLEVGTFVRTFTAAFRATQPILRVDHNIDERNIFAGRWAFNDHAGENLGSVGTAPGFDTSLRNRHLSVQASYTRVISPTATKELRLAYNRSALTLPNDATSSLAVSLPAIVIAGFPALGVPFSFPQGRTANNFGLQGTVAVLLGRHSFRFGADILLHRSRQESPASQRGRITFQASPGFTSWANFIDDFGGSGAIANRDFGSNVFYPDFTRNALFFQDRWRATNSLTLTLGLRHEYFGLPMNSLPTPAFAGLFNVDTRTWTGPYSEPNRVAPDRNNFSPAAGVAYAPRRWPGALGKLTGERKLVLRAGYQIGYDSFFNDLTANTQASTPNLLAASVPSVIDAANPRGRRNWLDHIPTRPSSPLPTDNQNLNLSNLVNPYYQRWSAGLQRQLPSNTILDLAYVGSKGTRLYIPEDLNPLVPPNLRIMPPGATPPYAAQGRLDNLQGGRTIRTNGGSSTYHSLQADLRKRMTHGLTATAAYTWSKLLDNGSELYSWGGISTGPGLAAIPSIFGGQRLERAVSAFDRTHRAVFTWIYELPWRAQKGIARRVAGGWRVSGVAAFESGLPFPVINGLDADGFGSTPIGPADRPDYNPSGRPGVRALVSAASPTGLVNPDAGNVPIQRSQAMYIQLPACNVTANPDGCRTGTLGRNTVRTPGINNFNINLLKTTRVTEHVATELRAEFFNIFNHPQYGAPNSGSFQPGTPPMQNNLATAVRGRFLNAAFMDGGARTVRLGLKVGF